MVWDVVMDEAGEADHPNGIKPSIPPDAAKGYIGVGVSSYGRYQER